jgi:hypothetical protein
MLKTLLTLLGIAGLVALLFFIYPSPNPATVPNSLEQNTEEVPGVTADLPSETGLLYQNEKYRFSLRYPEGLQIKEFDEGYDSATISFENLQSGEGFQIFVTPYLADTISDERFKKDQPSGVIMEPVEVIIDNMRATMFFGQNQTMGDTREVWFIKNKYLYEVTTYKQLDAWLATIMQSWKFL